MVCGLHEDAKVGMSEKEREGGAETGKQRARSHSRTLVKQRQPWDSPPKKRMAVEGGDGVAVP